MSEKILASSIKPMWTPKGPVVESQCASCPFLGGGGKLNEADEALKSAQQAAALGLDFHCHCTVYRKPFTEDPRQRPQKEWRVCAGAVAYKRNLEVTQRKAILRSQGRLIEDEGEQS